MSRTDGALEKQAQAAARFLRRHTAGLSRLQRHEKYGGMTLDFGVYYRPSDERPWPSYKLPAALVEAAGKHGIEIELSFYGSGIPDRIFHITSETDAARAMQTGEYVPRNFEADGFIHCSYAHQVTKVANLRFRGQSGLVLLEIDPASLDCEVVDENLEGGAELFPHIYGPLPLKCVVKVHAFPCSRDGTFELPLSAPA